MGQTHFQSSGQQINQYSSSCCLSRRYIIHSKRQRQRQRQNKVKFNNNKNQQSFQPHYHHHHELYLYSKQLKQPHQPTSNPSILNPSPPHLPTPQTNSLIIYQQKYPIQEIANLQLESHLLSKIATPQNCQDLPNLKNDNPPPLHDLFQDNQRNSTRDNSLSSKNFSHKNYILKNNHKLINKIKNLKFKYTIAEQPNHNQSPLIQYLPKITHLSPKPFTETTQIPNENTGFPHTKLSPQTNSTSHHKSYKIHKNQPQKILQCQPSDGVEFFSSDSDTQSSSSSQNSQQSKELQINNDEMLSYRRIHFIVDQFHRNLQVQHKIGSFNHLQKIPEESLRIQSSKSQNQLPNSKKSKIYKTCIPIKILQETHLYRQQNLNNAAKSQKHQNLRNEVQKVVQELPQKNFLDKQQKVYVSLESIKGSQYRNKRAQRGSKMSENRIHATPGQNKKIIPF